MGEGEVHHNCTVTGCLCTVMPVPYNFAASWFKPEIYICHEAYHASVGA